MADFTTEETSADTPQVFAFLIGKLSFSNCIDFHRCGLVCSQLRIGCSGGALNPDLELNVIDSLSHVAGFG